MMDRWACVDVFSFRLQILLSDYPAWLNEPTAVVDRDDPQGRLLELNRHAKEARLRRGMRYGQALALVPNLRARAVDDALVLRRARAIAETLGAFSPRVEHDEEQAGLFWLDASGLGRLYPDWRTWVAPLKKRLLAQHQVYITIVIGFSRFGTFAVARATGRSGSFASREDEQQAYAGLSLEALGMEPQALKLSRRLGVKTIADLLALPPEGLRRRLGKEAFALYRRAQGELREPLSSFHQPKAPRRVDRLDYVETNRDRLLFLIKAHLPGLLQSLAKRSEKLVGLRVQLHRRDPPPLIADVRPAAATDDELLILDLLRLRLENLPLDAGITDIVLTAEGERTTTQQTRLFAQKPRRDIDAANRALAQVRAEFGADTVLHIIPLDGHLPEARFRLDRLQRIALPPPPISGSMSDSRRAILRFFPTPIALRHPPGGAWLAGPHIICGGWWIREVHRDYHLRELPGGRLLWIFYDHRRRRWYQQGEF